MPGKQNADPIPATTYAGFAAPAPSEAAANDPDLRSSGPDLRLGGPDLRLSGETRTYAREELRRRTTRRRRTPVAAAVGLAVIVVGAAVGVALLYEPKMEFAAPSPPPPADIAEASLPSATAPIPPIAPIPEKAPPVEPTSIDVPPAGPPVAAPKAAARPVAHTAVAAKTPATPKPRSSTQAAADRAATDRVSALAALDQEVNRAYGEALRAGAPAGPLAETQENWIIRRDRVRREDPEMAEDLARARIAELHSIAAKDPEGTTSGP